MKTILLVEDCDDIRELVAELLRDDGFDVDEAENGKVALEILETLRSTPCLVLLDLMMPVMSGPELLQVLHETHRLAALPVVVLSAGGQPADALDASKFLRKPADPKILLALVHDLCGTPVEHGA